MSSSTSISAVIRTFNSAKTLGEVLEGLKLLEGDELIVVDSGSTDSTLQIAARYGAKMLIAPPPFHYSKSLNLGFEEAKNPWVLVLSSHSVPMVSDLLGVYRSEIAKFPEDVVVGYAPSTLSGKSDSNLPQKKTSYFCAKEYKDVCGVCGNGNSIYRRLAWEELSFDESIRTSEDKLWIMEMISRERRFAYLPMAMCLNMSQYSLVYMFKKGYRDARTLRSPGHRPMKLWQLAGALKKLTIPTMKGEIIWGNWLRYSAHTLGQFLASYKSEDNNPINGAS
jgi:glycosyltransferase involved in cell wall biosynthesis